MANATIEFWQDLTTTEFDGLDPVSTLALLPVAAIEQHGPHLPLSTDLIMNRGIVHEAITRLGIDKLTRRREPTLPKLVNTGAWLVSANFSQADDLAQHIVTWPDRRRTHPTGVVSSRA